jgi:large subunit ribosomal protein L21
MFAVIKTGGKQYRVAANDLLKVEKLVGNPGDIIEFSQVLAVGNGDQATIGAPLVAGAVVTAEVVKQGRHETVIAFKKRRRQNSRRTRGHRQHETTVRIDEILTDGAKPSKKKAAKADAAPKAEAPKAEAKAEAAAKPQALMAETAPKAEAAPKAAKPAKSEAKAAPAAAEYSDDISLIGGIGPVLKKKLEAAGFGSLASIAALGADDVAKLDADLKLGGRIERDEWIEQAKELIAGKPPRAKADKEAAAKAEKE